MKQLTQPHVGTFYHTDYYILHYTVHSKINSIALCNAQYNVHNVGGLVFLGAEADSTSFQLKPHYRLQQSIQYSVHNSVKCSVYYRVHYMAKEAEKVPKNLQSTFNNVQYIVHYSILQNVQKILQLLLFNIVLEAERQVCLSDLASS